MCRFVSRLTPLECNDGQDHPTARGVELHQPPLFAGAHEVLRLSLALFGAQIWMAGALWSLSLRFNKTGTERA